MNLNVKEWKEFYVGKIFRLEPTKGKTTDELEEGNDIPYIGAKHDTQGFMQMCKLEGFEDWVSKGNCIVFVQLGAGAAGYVNYMPQDFIGMNGKTSCGYIDGILNEKIGIFLETLLCKERPKYSFGRSWTGDRLENTIIKLPIQYQKDDNDEFILDKENHKIPIIDNTKKYSNDGYVPNWKFMEDYIKSLNHKPLTTENVKIENQLSLNTKNWKEFQIGKLFEIRNGKKHPADIREFGNLPLISTSAINNGVSDYIKDRKDGIYSNILTVAYSGSVGATFYHETNVFVGETVFALVPKFTINKYNGLFLTQIFNFENFKYSYGRKIIGSKYGNTTLKLPIQYNKDGTPKIDKTYKYNNEGYIPDWAFMEKYIKSLPYGDRI